MIQTAMLTWPISPIPCVTAKDCLARDKLVTKQHRTEAQIREYVSDEKGKNIVQSQTTHERERERERDGGGERDRETEGGRQ